MKKIRTKTVEFVILALSLTTFCFSSKALATTHALFDLSTRADESTYPCRTVPFGHQTVKTSTSSTLSTALVLTRSCCRCRRR